jgi:hypothetical protein
MKTLTTKPTLIFFQYKYDERLPKFILAHKRDHVKCLSEFFNVVVVDHDCDYQQICGKHQPDLTLFEGGVPFPSCDRPKIRNPRAHPEIPKVGFLHSDAFCCGRAGFLSDMDHLGIETYFAIATTAVENTPAISDSLFIWPNFVDPELYRDYGIWKSIPVLFTGNNTALYPWRQRMVRLISKHYSSLICHHPGYRPQKEHQQISVGESYARMLNASWLVPSCGTLAKEVVRKHFEIPACKACLVAEPSRTLEAAGFTDMVSCVFAEEHDVLDKLSFLFKNSDALDKIIQAGHELVHRSHTIKQRDQILQWYELNKALQPHQKIVQLGPFEPLQLVDRSSGRFTSNLIPNGLHLQLLRQGDLLLAQHDYGGAERIYLKCVQHIPWMPEPKLRLALCNLYKGNAKLALSWISEPIQFTLSEYRAVDPDPVEWAYFIVATICLGDLGGALKHANQFLWLYHPELDRARRAIMILSGRRITRTEGDGQLQRYRRSIHQTPQRSDEEWLSTLCNMLTACSRRELAERLRNYLNRGDAGFENECAGNCKSDRMQQEGRGGDELCADDSHLLTMHAPIKYFRRRRLYSKIRASIKGVIKRNLYVLESKYGYFLPHHLSSSRNDEFYQMIYHLARGEKGGSALIVGADWRGRSTQALIAGFREREDQSRVFCLRTKEGSRCSQTSKDDFVKWYGPLSPVSGDTREQLQRAISRIREDNGVGYFDIVLIDGSENVQDEDAYDVLYKVLCGAKYVLLDAVDHVYIHQIYRRLQSERRHRITSENPNLRRGYAIFERRLNDDQVALEPVPGVMAPRMT